MPLPKGPEQLRRYFVSVGAEHPEDAHWSNGVMMCDWWLRLMPAASVSQAEIDSFSTRLAQEKDFGSGWIDLGMQFRHWARDRGFIALGIERWLTDMSRTS
jgi:hypothetical protein